MNKPIKDLFKTELKIVNIGLGSFTQPFEQKEVKFVQVDFRPSLQVSAKSHSKMVAFKSAFSSSP